MSSVDEGFTLSRVIGDLNSALPSCGLNANAWAVMGGVAANAYRSTPRLSGDIDVIVLVDPSAMAYLANGLKHCGWNVHRKPPDGSLLRCVAPCGVPVDFSSAGTEYQSPSHRHQNSATSPSP